MVVDILAGVALATLIAVFVWRLSRRRHDDDLAAIETWLEHFSPDSYLPMLRLAEGSDAPFLSKHRGPEETARYRRLQRQMLRDYLRGLARDFHRLHGLAAGSDPGNLALALVDERMAFSLGIWSIEARLLLNEIVPCAVNLRPLLANVEQLTDKAREITRRRVEFRVS